ncbi:MAG TPA: TIGR02281 family clan AA aspartic protease [Usitatibacter sp.]|nr:TIGR02281 family clan AA aspartic protease [Usitatibacter sp.]
MSRSLVSILVVSAAAALAADARAADVNVIGLFSGKAVIVVNRGAPRTLAAGQTSPEGIKLISADSRAAVLEIDGQRQTLEMGQHFETPALTGALQTVTLAPDSRGHFITDGQVNGQHVRFLVDTGATMVSIPAAAAARLGIDFRRGRKGVSQTANGATVVYNVMLDSVTVGGITIMNVEGLVHEAAGLDVALLGMSFLGRTDMRRDGANLTLVKRY